MDLLAAQQQMWLDEIKGTEGPRILTACLLIALRASDPKAREHKQSVESDIQPVITLLDLAPDDLPLARKCWDFANKNFDESSHREVARTLTRVLALENSFTEEEFRIGNRPITYLSVDSKCVPLMLNRSEWFDGEPHEVEARDQIMSQYLGAFHPERPGAVDVTLATEHRFFQHPIVAPGCPPERLDAFLVDERIDKKFFLPAFCEAFVFYQLTAFCARHPRSILPPPRLDEFVDFCDEVEQHTPFPWVLVELICDMAWEDDRTEKCHLTEEIHIALVRAPKNLESVRCWQDHETDDTILSLNEGLTHVRFPRTCSWPVRLVQLHENVGQPPVRLDFPLRPSCSFSERWDPVYGGRSKNMRFRIVQPYAIDRRMSLKMTGEFGQNIHRRTLFFAKWPKECQPCYVMMSMKRIVVMSPKTGKVYQSHWHLDEKNEILATPFRRLQTSKAWSDMVTATQPWSDQNHRCDVCGFVNPRYDECFILLTSHRFVAICRLPPGGLEAGEPEARDEEKIADGCSDEESDSNRNYDGYQKKMREMEEDRREAEYGICEDSPKKPVSDSGASSPEQESGDEQARNRKRKRDMDELDTP